MAYTIAEAAKRVGLTAHTLRYYDKEGLTPYVGRDSVGNRTFDEKDFHWLELITCLKNSGMPIKKIKEYVELSIDGDSTLEVRLQMMQDHKRIIENSMAELEKYMEKVDYKIWYYETAIAAGTEDVHKSHKVMMEKQKQHAQ